MYLTVNLASFFLLLIYIYLVLFVDLQYSGTVSAYTVAVKGISHKILLLLSRFNASYTKRSVLLHHLMFVELYKKSLLKFGID